MKKLLATLVAAAFAFTAVAPALAADRTEKSAKKDEKKKGKKDDKKAPNKSGYDLKKAKKS